MGERREQLRTGRNSARHDRPGNASRSRRIAYHEAGHGVVAWALAIEVGGMRIAVDGDDGGCDLATARHLPIVQQLAICYAGIIGGDLSGEPSAEGEGDGDLAMAREILRTSLFRRSPGQVHMQVRARAKALARDLLCRHQETVRTLAEKLSVRDLDRAEIVAMLADVGRAGDVDAGGRT
jgi:hypothetical protein